MSTAKLNAEPRNLQAGKPKQLRRTGMVPVIVYGKTQTPVLLQVAERPLDTTLRHSGSQLIEVSVAGGGKHNILVREVQRDPVTHRVLHADFYAVAMNEKQHVSVSITGAHASSFSPTGGTCAGAASLPPGTSCTLTVRFAPTSAGAKSATLSVGTPILTNASLLGTGL